jgi:hypothetical protein
MMSSIRSAFTRGVCVLFVLLVCSSRPIFAEVFVRWDLDRVPSPQSLGISALVVRNANRAAIKAALARGYRVYVEADSAKSVPAAAGASLAGVIVTKPGAKWPHVRTNWVTKNKDVLQVTGRSAQPWIENNAALIRILQAGAPKATPVLTYDWTPITLSDVDEGPSLDDYLVAIAESGSFGGDLVLPLHERFQKRLLAGEPDARAEWNEIKRYLEFYSWDLANRYKPIANIGVVAAQPMLWFEAMNLMARHNLPFVLLRPDRITSADLDGLKLVIVLDKPVGPQLAALDGFGRKGGKVHTVEKALSDPNAFALEMRKLAGADDRVIDIWNGITVLTAPYAAPEGGTVLVTALNYAHQPQPVQLRVKGTFSVVHYESPEEGVSLLSLQHRNGYTEFVLPALRVGGRVFLGETQRVDR